MCIDSSRVVEGQAPVKLQQPFRGKKVKTYGVADRWDVSREFLRGAFFRLGG